MKQMIKENKLNIILSSLITLFPMLVGVIFWNKLPNSMATHFGVSGAADGFSSKAFAVFGLPLMLLAFHWLMILFMSLDKNTTTQSKKIVGILLYLMPMISVVSSCFVYSSSLGNGSDKIMIKILPAFFALLLIAMGNYLPKLTTNSTVGIKLPWVYTSESNWQKTHRFGGRVWVVSGIVMLTSILLPLKSQMTIMFIIIAIAMIAPTVYSYTIYKKELESGKCKSVKQTIKGTDKLILIIVVVLLTAMFTAVGIVSNTGDIEIKLNENDLTIEADYYKDLTVAYNSIKSVELRQTDSPGSRTNGFGSARLLMGAFKNDEFGAYTRYTYTKEDCCIVLKDTDGNVMVLGAKSEEKTLGLYKEITKHIKTD